MQITLGEWQAIGDVGSDAEHRLILPVPPSGPGLYRIRLLGADPSVYVGETEDLGRRFQNYRTPDRSQRTNRRMNEQMFAALRVGQHVAVETCTAATIEVGPGSEALDLSVKSHRLLAEEAALAQARGAGFGRVENVGG